jgi:hypothetical protein
MKKCVTFFLLSSLFISITNIFAQQGARRNDGLESITFNYVSFAAQNSSNKEVWLNYNKQYPNHPDEGKVFYFTPNRKCVELISKRTEHEKYYVDPDQPSKFYTQTGYEPLHYRRGNDWITIDPRIQPIGIGQYEATNQVEPVGFDVSKKSSYIKTSSHAKVSLNQWKLYGEKDGVVTTLAESNWTKLSAGDDGIYITEIFPGIDAEMRTTRGGVKTNFIVKKEYFASYTNLIFKDHFESESPINLEFKHNSTLKKQVGEAYISYDNKSIVEVKKGIMYADGIPSTAADIAYNIDGLNLEMIIPNSYISKYIGHGSVIIDPLVTGTNSYAASTIGSKYNASCSYSNSCDYTMSVSTPAGATFTDVKWSFAVLASSPCGLSNGVWNIRTGTCVPGYIWFCSGGAGACGGTISEWGLFNPCLPAPSCSSSSLDFTLKMWRGCVGVDTGCTTTCFSAYNNWVMTIEGHTVEHANKIAISTAKDSVCANSSVIFSKVTQYGVAPYSTTNWSTDRSGTPSIGTGDSVTRTFPASGIYWTYARTTDACGNLALDSQRIFVSMPLTVVDTSTPEICLGQSVNITASAATKGNAIDFNGASGNYITIPNSSAISLAGSSNFTVSAWVYPRANKHQQILFHGLGCSSWNNWTLSLGGFEAGNEWWPKKLGFIFLTGNGSGPNYVAAADTVIPNQWVHVAVTYDGSTLKLYLNGVLNNTASASGTPWNSPENLYVGFDPGCGGRIPYNGKLDEVQIWNKTRTATEISNSYRGLASPSSSNLVGYWRFDENNGKNVYDVTSNANYGTITGTVSREIPSSAPLDNMASTAVTYSWAPTTGLSPTTGASVTANPTITTNYTITTTQTSTGCTNVSMVRVQVDSLPATPVVVSPVVYCQGTTASPLSATGTNLKWYTVASGGTSSTIVPTPSTSTVGTTTYYVSQTITATGCEGPRSAITVTVNATPNAPVVSTPVNLCVGGATAALTATLGTPTDSLFWYATPTGGTRSLTAPTPSTATVGTTIYYGSLKTNLGCEGPRSAITVNVNPLPTAPLVTASVVYCQGTTAAALTAVGTNLKWYTTATGGVGSSTAPTPSTATVGSTVFYVSQSSSAATGSCEGPRSAITVTINSTPTAPVVTTPIVYCQGATATALTATKISITDSIFWYNSATGGTGTTTAPTPSTSASGTTLFYVSLKTNLGCEGPRSLITVNINPLPAAPAVTALVNLCVGGSSSALTATGTGLLWYTSAAGGIGSSTAPTPSTAVVGTTTYYVSQTIAATGCEGPRAAITVVVNTLPTAPTVVTPVNLCIGGSVSALTATGTNLKWYTVATGGTGSSTAPTPSTASVGSTSYYVTQTSAASVGSCEGSRSTITVVVNPLPSAPAVTTPLNLCIGVPASALTATGINLKWYTAATGGTASTTAPTPSTGTLGTTNYYVSQSSVFGCEGSRAIIAITVQPSPVLTITPVGVPDFVFCDSRKVTLKANAPTAISYQWQTLGSSIVGATSDTFSAGIKRYYGVTVIDGYGCIKTDSVLVKDNPLPMPILSPTGIQQCEGVSITLYCTPATVGYVYQWIKDGVPMAVSTTADNTSVALKGNYTVQVTDIYTCVKTTNVSAVSTYPTVVKPNIIRLDPVLKLDKSYYKYQWYRNLKPIFGANSLTYIMLYDGAYFAEVGDVSDCTNYSDTVQISALGINGMQINNGLIKIYPNPTKNILNIDAPINVDVVITDVVGKIVLTKKEVKSIDLTEYADGTYFFRIFDQDGRLILVEKVNKMSNDK